MSTGHVVVDGAMCKCKFGFTPDSLSVKSQTKAYINDGKASKKLIGNTKDLGNPFKAKKFGKCKLKPKKSGFRACVPIITKWQNPYNKVVLPNQGKILTENSKAVCATAGSPCVEFIIHGQVVTGPPKPLPDEEQEMLSQLDPLASEMVLTAPIGVFPTTEITTDNSKDEMPFKVFFLRDEASYKGEFGFDWMRPEYFPQELGGNDVSKDFEKLKKEYAPAGEKEVWKYKYDDYFVPWVSMFPKQKGVKLLLEGTLYHEFAKPDDTDVVLLPKTNGVSFKDECGDHVITQVKLSDIFDPNINVLVTLWCENAVTEDFVLELTDKDNEVVGKLNFYANKKQYEFEITPVIIRRNISFDEEINATSRTRDTETVTEAINNGGENFGEYNFKNLQNSLGDDLENLKKQLNAKYLNQALLQTTINEVHTIDVEETDWLLGNSFKQKDFFRISDHGFKEEESFRKERSDLSNVFYRNFKEKYGEKAAKKGIIVFLIPLEFKRWDTEKGLVGGSANTLSFEVNYMNIYLSALSRVKTYAHEFGHLLSLQHNYGHSLTNDNQIKAFDEEHSEFYEEMEKDKRQNAGYHKRIIELEEDQSDEFSIGKIKALNILIKEKEKLITKAEERSKKLNKAKDIIKKNAHKFSKFETDNIMDYSSLAKGILYKNSFYKWQWDIMRDSVSNQYGKETNVIFLEEEEKECVIKSDK